MIRSLRLPDLIQLKETHFKGLEESQLDRMFTNVDEGHLYGVSGSSGGYAETVFRYAAETLFGSFWGICGTCSCFDKQLYVFDYSYLIK
ncbi:hypothetical protein LWI29_030734 [Acer saccharum]|uniref:Uncharacterized protein n=1 Tax=Acer saccharum TaxID=4024 RepID=A0AA39SXD9_ACESA|nr:hypothetical protein LWI29_030734 [Acer saccharum]